MIWDYLSSKVKQNSNSYIKDSKTTIRYDSLLCIADFNGMKLSQYYPLKSKCVIICERSLNTAISVLSTMKAGLTPVVLSTNYGVAHNNNILLDFQPDLVITDTLQILTGLNTPVDIFLINEDSIHPVTNEKRLVSSEAMLEDVSVIMYTSGTTGFPKGAMISEDGLKADLEGIQAYFPVNSSDTILISRPLYHCAVFTGEFLLGLVTGANIVFLDGEYNPFSIMHVLEENKITVICGTPSLFSQLSTLVLRLHFKPHIRLIAISGECLVNSVANYIIKAFPCTNIFNVYGLTEASPRVTYLPSNLFKEHSQSVGVPIMGDEIRIVDDDDNEVDIGKNGHLLVKGPNVMKGYYHNDSNIKIKNGWLYTGDIASMDKNGLLYISGRADDRINKAGMNIYPKEIENLLQLDERVKDVLAYAITRNNTNGIGVLLVLYEEYQTMSIRQLFELAARWLPSYLIPDDIQMVDSIPRNASGKKNRRKDSSINI